MSDVMVDGWNMPVEVPHLDDGLIHVWLLEIDANLRAFVEGSLSPPEVERAAAFRFPVHRDEFIIARGALRFLLGKYLGVSPAEIDICCTDAGKPYLPAGLKSNIHFNVSHSGGYACFGFTTGDALGIDIELHQPAVIDDGLLEQCLTDAEKERLTAAPYDGRVQFFFDTWARKEAYMKLMGEGLSIPPNSFALSSAETVSDGIKDEEIRFAALPQIDGYSAVIATRDHGARNDFYKLGSNLLR